MPRQQQSRLSIQPRWRAGWSGTKFLTAEHVPDLHLAGAFDLDHSHRFAVERVLDQFEGAAGDLDASRASMGFHPTRKID